MVDLSDKTLHVVCKCLDLPQKILFKDKSKWRCCMTILTDWEDLSSENDTSKKTLAIKLMKAADEIHKQNKEESKKLEIIARSLDYKGKINYFFSFDICIISSFTHTCPGLSSVICYL